MKRTGKTGWDWVRSLMWDRGSLHSDAVHATLAEVERRIKEMQPAPQSRLTFDGGRNRALRMVRDMQREVSAR